MKLGKRGRFPLVLALAALTALTGCLEDDEVTLPEPGPGGELFSRYVAIGNSITAGYQSAGINDSTQRLSYPNLLAERAGADFTLPLLAPPGCPPPLTVPITSPEPVRVGMGTDMTCALRVTPTSALIQNYAVPGARILDAVNNLIPEEQGGAANVLTTLILGGRTQVGAMVDARPTLVSVWLGNNDVLGAALSGSLAALTPEAAFVAALGEIADSILITPAASDAILIGVVNVNVVPLLQPGAYFFLLGQAGAFDKPVNPNCSPVTAAGQPNPLSRNLISFAMVGDAGFPEINCADDAYPEGDPRRGIYVLSQTEQAALADRVEAYNAAIAQVASDNGWIYVDPNDLLAQFLLEQNEQGLYQRIRKCQALAGANTPEEFQRAVAISCPVTGPTAAPNFFGSLISLDGVHPSSEAHRILADALAQALGLGARLSVAARRARPGV